jgi:two-component system response regulator AtoC
MPTDVAPQGDRRSPATAGPRLVAMWNGGSLVYPIVNTTQQQQKKPQPLVIGRGTEADVRIDHTSVSRRHAVLHFAAEADTTTTTTTTTTMRVEDLGSANGTWVDGKRLAPGASAPVEPGILFELGSVLFIVHSGAARAPTASSSSPSSPPPPRERKPGEPVVVDPQMERVYELVDLVAKSALSVILLGETGVGKELLATRIHTQSPRAKMPFLKLNCAAFMESLLESELFGHERGAFTGATHAKPGMLEGAHGGTLLLDEIGELPLNLQAKLLRGLESGEVTRIGSLKPRPVDVRFVSATNRDLREWVALGRFRQDLFFRLDGISIQIPPLRTRTSEIPALALAFAQEACANAGKAPITISEDAITRLVHHHLWPGNIRELRNVIARSVLLCPSSTLTAADLRFEGVGNVPSSPPPSVVDLSRLTPPSSAPSASPSASSPPPMSRSSNNTLDPEEERRIRDALERSAGNQTRAAKMLGISRRTLLKRLDVMGVRRPHDDDDDN